MMLQQRAGYFKIVFTIMLFGVALVSVNSFSDYNLLPRLLLLSTTSALFFLPIRKISLGIEELLLIGFYLLNISSCFWTDNVSFAMYESQRTFLYFITYFVGKRILQSYGLLFLSRLIVLMTSTVIFVNGTLFLFYGESLQSFSTTSAHTNLLSSFFLLCLPFSLILFFKGQKKWRFLAAIITLLILLSMVGLGARSVFLGLLLFALVYIITELKTRGKKQLYSFIGLMLLVSAGGFALYSIGLIEINTTSLEERVFIWKKTLLLIADQPMLGVGAGNWIFNYPSYGISGFDTFEIYGLVLQRPHNDLLWIIAELGIIGFTIISVFWLLFIKVLYGAKKTKERTILLSSLISFLPILLLSFPKERVEHIFLFFILLAVAMNLQGKRVKSLQLNWFKYPVILISLFSILLLIFNAKGDWYSNKALKAMKNNEPEKVISNNKKATSFFYSHTIEGVPLASFTAWAYNQLKDKKKMFLYSHLAYLQAPNNYEIVTNYGMALNSQRRFNEAEKILLRANYINPRYDGCMLNLAVLYYNMGEFEKAKKWIELTYHNTELSRYYRQLIDQKLN